VADLAEENARLMRQAEYFASDDRIKERAAMWRGVTPEDCLAAVVGSCKDAEFLLRMKDAATLERVLRPEPLPPDTEAILECLQTTR
jgi:hypothetical protein